jgi:hypothetical protein
MRFFVVRLAIALGAMVLAPVPAEASFCLVDGIFVEVNPPAGSVVPGNVRIRVRLTLAPERVNPPGRIALRGSHWSRHLHDVEVRLRTAAGQRATAWVPAARQVMGMPGERIIELVPKQPLAPGRYEVAVTTPHQVPRARGAAGAVKPSPSRHVVTFIAGASLDHTRPTWAGLAGAEVAGRRTSTMVKPDGRVVTWGDSGRSAPWVVARAPGATDDATPASALVYAVWVADPARGIDYTRPPLSHLALHNGRILAGRDEAVPEGSMCDVTTFPSLDVRQPSPLRIGVRALDWAGNASPPSEVILDAKAP